MNKKQVEQVGYSPRQCFKMVNIKSNWVGKTKNGEFSVQLNKPIFKVLNYLCFRARDNETGGILIGRYSDDLTTAIVEEVTGPPPDSVHNHSSFIRGTKNLNNLLRRRWYYKDRTYYLGEWHYHQSTNLDPSDEDISTMNKISQSENCKSPEPILIILGKPEENKLVQPMRIFVFPLDCDMLEFFNCES